MAKVWLSNLKKGDTFYQMINHQVQKCEIIGRVEDNYFRMPRISFKLCNYEDTTLTTFVNKYVYTDEESVHKY